MATIALGTSFIMKVKTKYNDNGTIKTATRTVSPQKNGEVNYDNTFENLDNVGTFLTKYQAITTDTVLSAEISWNEVITVEGGYGEPGTIDSAWADFEDVRLVNSYTDGENTAKETVKRVATGASEDDLLAYGVNLAKLGDPGTTAISGYYTGSSVESAWVND